MKILKTLASAGLILTFITGIWFIDDRYVDAKDLNNLKDQLKEVEKERAELKKRIDTKLE